MHLPAANFGPACVHPSSPGVWEVDARCSQHLRSGQVASFRQRTPWHLHAARAFDKRSSNRKHFRGVEHRTDCLAARYSSRSNAGRREDAGRDSLWQGTGTRPYSAHWQLRATASKSVPPPPYVEGDAAALVESELRVRRLSVLVQLRKLYRNLIRADGLLALPSPVYRIKDLQIPDGADAEEIADLKQQMIDDVVEAVAEMQLTAEQLKAALRTLNTGGFGIVLGGDQLAEEAVRVQAQQLSAKLADRARKELAYMPFNTRGQAQAALDARNARYRGMATRTFMDDENPPKVRLRGAGARDGDRKTTIERLEEVEKVAGKFVAKRLPRAVQKVRDLPPEDWLDGVRSAGNYAKGFWIRLNGGGRTDRAKRLPAGLPAPASTKEERAKTVGELGSEMRELEKRLQEASKARETRLRKASLSQRARMAAELREMDDQITSLSRTLAVRALQLQMEYIYGCLEDEALDIAEDALGSQLNRRGSSDETALLVAEFGLLDEGLAGMRAAIDRGEAALVPEEDLERLASEIPDMRTRLGIGDDKVFSGQGLGLQLQLQVQESVAKVTEGVQFFARGIRLMGSDISNSSRLFMRAATGGTLRPREVQALRRTVKDFFSFIPFAIILIAPITPVGHVLVFGFIQRYFPGFFPTQFSNRRQELMIRYEELKKQLAAAKELVEQEDDEIELARAKDAVERLVAPVRGAAAGVGDLATAEAIDQRTQAGGSGGSGTAAGGGRGLWGSFGRQPPEGTAARVLQDLERQVKAAEKDTMHTPGDDE